MFLAQSRELLHCWRKCIAQSTEIHKHTGFQHSESIVFVRRLSATRFRQLYSILEGCQSRIIHEEDDFLENPTQQSLVAELDQLPLR